MRQYFVCHIYTVKNVRDRTNCMNRTANEFMWEKLQASIRRGWGEYWGQQSENAIAIARMVEEIGYYSFRFVAFNKNYDQ